MSHTAKSARVVSVAAGVEDTDRPAPARDGRHEALAVLIGNWINEGHTIGTGDFPSVAILASDVYEWAPGGFFVVHSAFGKIGETSVGGIEMIGGGAGTGDRHPRQPRPWRARWLGKRSGAVRAGGDRVVGDQSVC